MLKKLLVGAGVVAAAVAFASPAQAAFQMTISDGTTTDVINDNGAGDNNPAVGTIGFNGPIGGFFVVTDTQFTNAPGSSLGLISTSVQISASPTAAGTLTVETTDTDFTLPGGNTSPMVLGSSGSVVVGGGAPGTTLSLNSYASSPALMYGMGHATATQSCSGGSISELTSNCATTSNVTTTFVRNGGYSLTDLITIHTGGALVGTLTVNGVTAASAVPEPGSMLLLGTGLFGLARVARRRFNLGAR